MSFKTRGIAVNNKLTVKFLKQGVSKNGKKWQFFPYNECKKNPQTGEYIKIRSYQIWFKTPIEDLKDDDTIIIKSISSFYESVDEFNGKKYNKIQLYIEAEKFVYEPNENEDFSQIFQEETFNFDNFDVDISELDI